jgi:glycosyltransferase involved in cell wall biosynthesis
MINSQRKLSVVVPCFNEERTIGKVLKLVLAQPCVGEIVIINDCSTDNSLSIIEGVRDSRIKIINHEKNLGKGKSVSEGLKASSLPFVVIQDADLEYDPAEYTLLLEPILENRADVVYGSRFLSGKSRRVLYYWHSVGNSLLTTFSNIFTNLNLTDMETCYKLMTREVALSLNLQEARFGIEPEITAQIAAFKVRIYEVAISYYGRTYEEGKKINWKDGFSALRCIVKYNLRSRRVNYKKIFDLNHTPNSIIEK